MSADSWDLLQQDAVLLILAQGKLLEALLSSPRIPWDEMIVQWKNMQEYGCQYS